jgi:PAS domain S-box-containing protein
MATQDDESEALRQVAIQNSRSIRQARMRAEDELRKHSEWLRVTLASIGDAVVSVDAEGRVNMMNRVAESLTGWPQAEALGHPLADVLRIVNERTREPVENPAFRALRDGTIVGLANHTILIARDGSERPIDDSAAPIRAADGTIIGSILIFRDITERYRAEKALRESEAESERQRRIYEAILNNTPDLAYVFDSSHRYTYANDGLLKMWGRTWDEAVGKTCLELGYEPWHAEMHDREIDQVIATGQPIRGEVPFTGTLGRRIYDYIFVPVFGANGEVEAVAGTTRDVTDRKLTEADREVILASERSARAEAERASTIKEEFLAMLSHELRTPLNAIVGWTQILRNKPPTAQTLDQGLSVIDRNARMQTQLIADLLDMSRIISGKMRLEMERLEFPVIIEAALDAVRPAADAKDIAIHSALDPITEVVNGDPMRLQQVVWNLLSNAVKFTPRGGQVRVTLARADSHVEISVSDTGKGIKPEFLPYVFERFRQADNTAAREHGGLGLGLAIVKQLVEVHGGSVHAKSDGEERGSTFTVHLPMTSESVTSTGRLRRQAVAARAASVPGQPPDLASVTVLVVDDEFDARDLIRRVLEECGAQVVLARSADDAFAVLEQTRPDVILSDIGMPGRDGYAFMNALRRGGSTIPAAALTAFARSEDRARALQAGYQSHVAKPLEPAELLATVAALVHKTTARQS